MPLTRHSALQPRPLSHTPTPPHAENPHRCPPNNRSLQPDRTSHNRCSPQPRPTTNEGMNAASAIRRRVRPDHRAARVALRNIPTKVLIEPRGKEKSIFMASTPPNAIPPPTCSAGCANFMLILLRQWGCHFALRFAHQPRLHPSRRWSILKSPVSISALISPSSWPCQCCPILFLSASEIIPKQTPYQALPPAAKTLSKATHAQFIPSLHTLLLGSTHPE